MCNGQWRNVQAVRVEWRRSGYRRLVLSKQFVSDTDRHPHLCTTYRDLTDKAVVCTISPLYTVLHAVGGRRRFSYLLPITPALFIVIVCLICFCLCLPGRREPGREYSSGAGVTSFSFDQYSSYFSYFPAELFAIESAHPTGRGNWWADVRAGTLVFVTTGARCKKRANERKQQQQQQQTKSQRVTHMHSVSMQVLMIGTNQLFSYARKSKDGYQNCQRQGPGACTVRIALLSRHPFNLPTTGFPARRRRRCRLLWRRLDYRKH